MPVLSKGEMFTEEEKLKLLDKHIEIMAMIIPKYKEILDRNQIEISTSPFYHPILPLLIDSSISKISSPYKASPKNIFKSFVDAKHQIKKGIDYYEAIFGVKPNGIWPSEGSVSDDVLLMIESFGIKWVASDEDILSHSTPSYHKPESYNVFKYQTTNLNLVFRDKRLSDLIGFSYSQMTSDAAVNNFISNLKAIKNSFNQNNMNENLITIILDGENCWEYFEDDGNKFLRALYTELESSNDFETTTISDFISSAGQVKSIQNIFPGSWINHNYDVWIGDESNNKAWDLLYKTREFLQKSQDSGDFAKSDISKAWEEIYIAEGSDWFWWYFDNHKSQTDLEFDILFRKHLKNVYSLLGSVFPVDLDISLVNQKHENIYHQPIAYISPLLDGNSFNFFDWYNAGYYETEKSGAMHKVTSFIKKFYFGYDADNFYFRMDTRDDAFNSMKNFIIVIDFNDNLSLEIKFSSDLCFYYMEFFQGNALIFSGIEKGITVDKNIEFSVPVKFFIKNFNKIYMILRVFENKFEIERWPQYGSIIMNII